MNPNEVDSIASLYDPEDGYASQYSATIDEELDSCVSNEVLVWPTFDEECDSWVIFIQPQREEEEVDPLMYCSTRYFVFTRGTYDLMVKDWSGQVKVTFETLSVVARGAPLNLHERRRMKSRLMLRNENVIYLNALPNLQVTYVENWREVVLVSHCDASLKRLWANDPWWPLVP